MIPILGFVLLTSDDGINIFSGKLAVSAIRGILG